MDATFSRMIFALWTGSSEVIVLQFLIFRWYALFRLITVRIGFSPVHRVWIKRAVTTEYDGIVHCTCTKRTVAYKYYGKLLPCHY